MYVFSLPSYEYYVCSSIKFYNLVSWHLLVYQLSYITDQIIMFLSTGSDIPGLEPGVMEEAFDALGGGTEMVLGQAEDGGYFLVGFSKAAVHKIGSMLPSINIKHWLLLNNLSDECIIYKCTSNQNNTFSTHIFLMFLAASVKGL